MYLNPPKVSSKTTADIFNLAKKKWWSVQINGKEYMEKNICTSFFNALKCDMYILLYYLKASSLALDDD